MKISLSKRPLRLTAGSILSGSFVARDHQDLAFCAALQVGKELVHLFGLELLVASEVRAAGTNASNSSMNRLMGPPCAVKASVYFQHSTTSVNCEARWLVSVAPILI
jgi:hypothetical protein